MHFTSGREDFDELAGVSPGGECCYSHPPAHCYVQVCKCSNDLRARNAELATTIVLADAGAPIHAGAKFLKVMIGGVMRTVCNNAGHNGADAERDMTYSLEIMLPSGEQISFRCLPNTTYFKIQRVISSIEDDTCAATWEPLDHVVGKKRMLSSESPLQSLNIHLP